MKSKLQFCLLFCCAFLMTQANPIKVSSETLPAATISYTNSQICVASAAVPVVLIGDVGGTFSASPVGLFIEADTGTIYPTQCLPGSYVVTYTIPPGAEPAFSTTTTVTILPYVSPTFPSFALTHCYGSTIPLLPTVSTNGITGTWSPAVLSNEISGTYTFIPDPGQCANVATIAITIVQPSMPTFTFVSHNICLGNELVLPTISNEGYTGTWTPDTVTATGAYQFTPDPGQCAAMRVETFAVDTLPTVTISPAITICEGSAATVVFTGTPNAIVTYAIDGSVNFTIMLDATGTATLTLPQSLIPGIHLICVHEVMVSAGSCLNQINSCSTITVTPEPIIPAMSSVTACDSYTLPVLMLGNYYTAPNGGGTMLNPGDMITQTQFVYVYVSNDCGADEEGFMINIFHTIVIPQIPDVTACGAYSLPPSNDYEYRTQPNGGGMIISPGNIYLTQTVYVYASTASTPSCVSESSFHVTIIPIEQPSITTENSVNYIYVDGTTVVQPLLLDATTAGNYSYQWKELHVEIPGANSPTYLVNNHIDQGWHYYSVVITNNDTNCSTESALFNVYETPVPAPVAEPDQTFGPGLTLAAIVVFGINVQWYDGLGRSVNATALPLSTPLVDGMTYYASQIINGFESPDRTPVTIHINLASDAFAFKDLKFSPNPVVDVLQIQSKDMIKKIEIFNIVGQKVMQHQADSFDLRLSLQQLKAGNYFIRLESDSKSQVIKVTKE